LPTPGIKAVRRAGAIVHAVIQKFVLEGGQQRAAADQPELRQRPTKEIARTAFPRRAVRHPDVAHEKMLARPAVIKVHTEFGGRVGHQHHLPGGAERRIGDRAEGGDHRIGLDPADPVEQAGRQVAGRKPFAAHATGHLTGTGHDQRFTNHDGPSRIDCRAMLRGALQHVKFAGESRRPPKWPR
jgi:hypothetical protein